MSNQGHYLCFIYEDGQAIVGTVEGNGEIILEIMIIIYFVSCKKF